jgi:crossover junction endodeoxyribonuclease RusA
MTITAPSANGVESRGGGALFFRGPLLDECTGYQFNVPGIPAPGGSKRAFVINGKARLTDAGGERNKNWRAVVGLAAHRAGCAPLDGPLELSIVFIMPRPKSHYRTGRHAGQLRPDAPHWHTSRPDSTKLTRSTEDALLGLCWQDDAQVSRQVVDKIYGDVPGARITVWKITTPSAGASTSR